MLNMLANLIKSENIGVISKLMRLLAKFAFVLKIIGYILFLLWWVFISTWLVSNIIVTDVYTICVNLLSKVINPQFMETFFYWGWFIGGIIIVLGRVSPEYPEIFYSFNPIRSYEDVKEIGLSTLAEIPEVRSSITIPIDIQNPTFPGYYYIQQLLKVRVRLLKDNAKCFLITSPGPAEGKTSISTSLAILCARVGLEVMLIDFDLRRPRLHSFFNLDNRKGLTNILVGEANIDSCLKPSPSMQNLKIITSGPIPPDPSDLILSYDIGTFLTHLKEKFDIIIIDAPPILFSEVDYLSIFADKVILVVKQNTPLKKLKRIKESLEELEAKIMGVILNYKGFEIDKKLFDDYGYFEYTYVYYNRQDYDDTSNYNRLIKTENTEDNQVS